MMKPVPGFISVILIIVVVSFIILAVPSALAGRETPRQEKASRETGETAEKGENAGEELKPIPDPQLDHLEKVVSDQLREGRRMVDVVSRDPSASRQKRAEAYGELGQLYHAYELFDAAEACYRNALILNPSHLEWTYSLGWLLQFNGRFSEALTFYQKMGADHQPPQLAYLVYIRMGECYRKLDQPNQAKSVFAAAYKLNPEEPAVLARLGEIALDEKQFDLAIQYLTSALEKQPEANRLHYSLGMAYRGKGDMEKAQYHLSRYGMVGIQPPDPVKKRLEQLVSGYRTQILAGKLAFSAKRYSEAAEAFERAIKANPEDADARVNLAAALGQLHNYKEAINQLREAIRLAPEDVTAHFNLGSLLANSGDYREAITHFRFVVEKNPEDIQAHLALANGFLKEKQFENAIRHYKATLSLEPGLTWGWIDLSSALSSTGQDAEALNVLEEAYSRLPNDGHVIHALARLLATSPDLSLRQGKRALELALKVFQAAENIEYARTVAFAYAELNQCDKAVEWMEKAIELASKSPNGASIIDNLKSNLEYFKVNRPCRVPVLREKR